MSGGHDHSPGGLPERVARVESGLEALEDRVDNGFRSLNDRVESGFREIARRIPNGRTDWGVLAAWAGAIVALIAMVGGSVLTAGGIALRYVHGRVGGLEARELDAAREAGALGERIANHGEHLASLDATLQREMRQLDDAAAARTQAAIETVRAEFGKDLAEATRDRFSGAQAAELERRLRAWVEGRP